MAKKERLSQDELMKQALVKEDKLYEVPSNWIWAKLFAFCIKLQYGYTETSSSEKIGPHYLRITDIQENKVNWSEVPFCKISQDDYCKFRLFKDDIVVARTGATTGKSLLLNEDVDAVFASYLIRISLNKRLLPRYLSYFMNSDYYWIQIIEEKKGIAQPGVNANKLGQINIPIPPLPEQQRIVDTIESLFEKLDRAEELVQNVLDSFEARKSSILHKAFNGELTAKWREENGVDFEREWEENLLGEICEINPKRISTKELDDDIEVSFVPMSSVSDIKGVIEQPLVKKLAEVKKGFTNFSVGDVIFAKITPCMENGKSAVVENLMNGIGFGSTEFHVLRCSERLYNRYLYHLVRWKKFRDEARQVMTGAVGQQRVPKEFLEQYTINTPPVKEQIEIVRILDNLLEKKQKARELCDIIIKNIEQLKKSILARAFRGELNTNNPGEESALELLKEVIQERMES